MSAIAKNGLFITGTDTGIGKTWVTGLLLRYFRNQHRNAVSQKWIQTDHIATSDVRIHHEIADIPSELWSPIGPLLTPYSFMMAASPHLAAQVDGIRIDPNRIKAHFYDLTQQFDMVIVEGIGGAFVPYSDQSLVLDIADDLHLPVILVVGNRLGAIHHSMATINALKQRKTPLVGAVFSDTTPKEDTRLLSDNVETICRMTAVPCLGRLYFDNNIATHISAFPEIGDAIQAQLNLMRK